MRDFMAIVKALADDNRVRVLLALRDRELCVCQVTELLELAPSTVSKHMALLKQAGLVDSRKQGRWIYYRLANGHAPAVVREAIAFVDRSLADDRCTRKDARRLAKILRCDPEKLCRKQRDEG